MTTVQQVQCPNCGAPLDVEEGRDSVFCSYCGSKLRIEKGASGHAIASLEGIEKNTDILAQDVLRRRQEEKVNSLRQQITELQRQSELAEQQRATQAAQPTSTGNNAVWLLIGIVLVFVGFTQSAPESTALVIMGLLLIVLKGIPIFRARQERERALNEAQNVVTAYSERIGALSLELEVATHKLNEANRRVDSLADSR